MKKAFKRFAKHIARRALPLTSPTFALHGPIQRLRKKAFTYPGDAVVKHYSQCGQDGFVVSLFGEKRGGTFLDIGAHDGVSFNNTCFLERALGWSGICVEPHPTSFERLKRNRSCVCVNTAVAAHSGNAQFLQVEGQGSMLSGLIDTHSDAPHAHEYAAAHDAEVRLIDVEARTVAELLSSHGLRTVDYINLDIEGGELDVLKTIDLRGLAVEVLSVENNYPDNRIEGYLHTQGYRLMAILGDEIYQRA